MIGDREHRDDEPPAENFGPLDAMIRLNPPPLQPGQFGATVPAFIERYFRLIVVRHVFPDGSESLTEQRYPTVTQAIHGMSFKVAFLQGRGYTVVDEARTVSREDR